MAINKKYGLAQDYKQKLKRLRGGKLIENIHR